MLSSTLVHGYWGYACIKKNTENSWKYDIYFSLQEFEGEFRGKRALSNDDLCLQMYSAEIQVLFVAVSAWRAVLKVSCLVGVATANAWWRGCSQGTVVSKARFVWFVVEELWQLRVAQGQGPSDLLVRVTPLECGRLVFCSWSTDHNLLWAPY